MPFSPRGSQCWFRSVPSERFPADIGARSHLGTSFSKAGGRALLPEGLFIFIASVHPEGKSSLPAHSGALCAHAWP